MQPTRRTVLRGGLYAGVTLAGFRFYPSRHATARVPDPRGTTLDSTVLRGAAGPGGWRPLVSGPPEPHVLRAELGGTADLKRLNRRAPVAVFAQFSDVHIVDAQSPTRVEFLDRYSDPPASQVPFSSAYRPQEMLGTQIADAMVRAVNNLGRGPVTGAPIAFTICTGDNIDNAQLNELRWFVDTLDGAAVRPDSGSTDRWEGVHDGDPLTYDVHYWHPDGTPAGKVDDMPRRYYGFPTVPGLLDAARAEFDATGLAVPWYTAFGNHDPLLQGNMPPNQVFNVIATGSVKVVALPAGLSPHDVREGLIRQDPQVVQALLNGPARTVTPDPNRRALTKTQWMAEHFTTVGKPVGHGFAEDNLATGRGYYAFDHGLWVRCIVLDTVNPGGYDDGSLDVEQFDWLKREVAAASASAGGRDRLVVLFSHHSLGTMENPTLAPGETRPRVLADEIEAELLKWPNVVLWVNGHTHRNQVVPHPTSDGTRGFWEVNTAAHIDWPAQSRIVEIVDNRDGTLSVFATNVDIDAPLAFDGNLESARSLAALARLLSANDWQDRPATDAAANEGGRRGSADDRNVELLLPAPFPLTGAPRGTDPPARRGRVNPPVLPATGSPDHSIETAAALALAAAGLAAARRRTTTTSDHHPGRE